MDKIEIIAEIEKVLKESPDLKSLERDLVETLQRIKEDCGLEGLNGQEVEG